VAALRCLYQHAVDDGLIAEADNPARKVAKPRRLPSTRRAVPDTRLAHRLRGTVRSALSRIEHSSSAAGRRVKGQRWLAAIGQGHRPPVWSA
jgi:hypothetical protein